MTDDSAAARQVGRFRLSLHRTGRRARIWVLDIDDGLDGGLESVRFSEAAEARAWYESIRDELDIQFLMDTLRLRTRARP